MKKIVMILMFTILLLTGCKEEPQKTRAADQKATEGTFEKVKEPKVPDFSSGAPRDQ